MYKEILKNIYQNKEVLKIKILEFDKFFEVKNPFFKFAKIKTFEIKEKGTITIIFDSRLSKDTALFGFFEFVEDGKTAKYLWEKAKNFCKTNNRKNIIGPINGTTWGNFRMVLPNKNQPFFSEPFYGKYYYEFFKNSDFEIIQKNLSNIHYLKNNDFNKYELKHQNCKNLGFKFEALSGDKETLKLIYKITQKTFKNTLCFVPISWEEFLFQFADLNKNLGEKNRSIIIKKDKKIVAFCFAFVDLFSEKQIIVKTMAVDPKFQGQGIASATFYEIYKKAKNQNFESIIFSTMKTNHQEIQKICQTENNIYRNYEVYQHQI